MPPIRSGEKPVLKIPPKTQTVRLRLFDNFGDRYAKYLIQLNDENGNEIWNQEVKAGKKLPQKSITVNISGDKLKVGSYEIAVSGITADGSVEEINFYSFAVEAK